MCRDYYPEYEEAIDRAYDAWYEQDRYVEIMSKIDIAKFLLKGLTDNTDTISIEEIEEIIETLEEAENI